MASPPVRTPYFYAIISLKTILSFNSVAPPFGAFTKCDIVITGILDKKGLPTVEDESSY
jgi:hypothetical protein